MNREVIRQLRQALFELHNQDPVRWTKVVAEEVVLVGGGDAVDMLQIALDDALADADRANPDDN